MRLVCPKCAVQYEVGEDAIPETGRSVQCSDCGHGWFQRRGPALPQGVPVTPDAPKPVAAPPPPVRAYGDEPAVPAPPPLPPRKPLDEHVMAILREEALREAAARRADVARATGQPTQPVPPLSGPPPADQTSRPRPEAPAPPQPTPDRSIPRRGLLPDIEEINSTLTPEGARPGGLVPPSADPQRGFRAGFALMTGLLAAAAAAYVLAPRITALLPQSTGAMTAYVGTVDHLRRQLDATVTDARQQVQSLLRSVE